MAALGIVAWTAVDELLSDDCDENDDIIYAMTLHALIREDSIKCMQYYEYTVQNYLPDTFKTFFKMTPATVEHLCQYLSECPTLAQREYPGGRVPIPLEKKVLMTVRFMASQETVKEIIDRFAVTEFSFLRSKHQVIDAINNRLLPKFVTWPKPEECVTIAERFENTGAYQLPNVIGAIDGSHIPIEAPLTSPNAYVNRKVFHSIILQAVCLPDLKFTDICVGWRGCVHDAKVLRNSALWNNGFQRTQNGNFHLLGDVAYPLKEWLLTPYRDNGHLTNQQNRFNDALSSKRQVIERAFGLLKGRFRKLKYINLKSIEETCKTIVAACVLHNICITEHDSFEDVLNNDEDIPDNQVFIGVVENDAQGRLKRVNLTNRLR